jgi:GDP/UDP-N,N'-diacetylbacillosamine 2-epimerase (hydrolysing)
VVRVAVLTSSRADFGVYLPLLRKFKDDGSIKLTIIAFGTHLSNLHGQTILEIERAGFTVEHRIVSILASDNEEAISTNVGLTQIKFASIWQQLKKEIDLALCLGDRFEMFAAVLAGVPFGIKFVHFYGGDRSSGAIDNVYRDCITMASTIHFTSTAKCAERVKLLTQSDHAYPVGVMSLEEDLQKKLLSIGEFNNKWGVNLSIPTVLLTVHPETVNPDDNFLHVKVVQEMIVDLLSHFQVVVTMPNADTYGSIYRTLYNDLQSSYSNIKLIENFGTDSYFTCLRYCRFVVGNTSSGISEAPSYRKYFINIGERQTGRELNANVLSVKYDIEEIRVAIQKVISLGDYTGGNVYYHPQSINFVLEKIKSFESEIV